MRKNKVTDDSKLHYSGKGDEQVIRIGRNESCSG